MYSNYPTAERPEIIEMIRDAVRKAPPVKPPPGPDDTMITIPCNNGTHKPPIQAEQPPRPPLPAPPAAATEPFRPPSGSLDQGDRMLNIKSAAEWMAEQRHQPAPKQLFGNFWLQGELCLLFADTNMGKSILAVQIGDSIAGAYPIAPFGHDAAAAPVLYIDFELSAKQFELRYRDEGGEHNFNPWFYRAEYNTFKEVPWNYKSFDEYMQATLDWAIRNTEPKTLIIDNITCLTEGNHQTAGTAISLMKYLKALQIKNKLSILVLAHTPKRPTGKTIGRDDMGGSKMLMNFADSAFAIGQSYADAGLRYLKQIKQRSGGQLYGADNICLMELERDNGFLRYNFCGYGHEWEHLHRPAKSLSNDISQQVTELHQQGISQRQIAARLQISASSVFRILNKTKAADGESD